MHKRRVVGALALGFGLLLNATSGATASAGPDMPNAIPPTAVNEPGSFLRVEALVKPGTPAAVVTSAFQAAGISAIKLRYAGPQGVGEYAMPKEASAEQISRDVSDLFSRIRVRVPPLRMVTGIVPATHGDPSRGLSTALAGHVDRVESRPATARSALKTRKTGPPVTSAVNDWPTYFPSFWRGEMNTVNRCVGAGGSCEQRRRLATFNQGIKWGDNGHTPTAWPDPDWGLEVGVNLYAPQPCIFDPAGNPVNYLGWWAKRDNYSWVTDLPSASAPYLDDNRASDECERLAVAFGVGYPRNVSGPAGYRYTFYIEQELGLQSASRMSADYQAVSNDCNNIGRAPDSDCMGLNTGRTFPYGVQSATLVASSRSWTVPACFAMRDQWAAPVTWANGSSKLMPSPLNYYDSCITKT